MQTCDDARRHLGAMRDREVFADPSINAHLAVCGECTSWLDRIDHATRALCVRAVAQPVFVDDALQLWDEHETRQSARGLLVGRVMLGVASLWCLVVGVLIAADSAGHTHIGVTAQREGIILEVALAFGLACAASRPRTFLPGVLPILVVVTVVNLGVSLVNLVSGDSSLLTEVAHLPFVIGLLGALLIHRRDPIRAESMARRHRPRITV